MTVRRILPPLLALVLGLLAAFATSCGSDDDNKKLLPASRAEDIRAELDKISERVERGECDKLETAFIRLTRAVNELPPSVDRRLKARLAEGVANLQQIAPGECQGNQPETTTTETVPPETTPPETTTTPPETTTTPPETTTTPPETTPPDVPPETVPPDVPPDNGGQEAP